MAAVEDRLQIQRQVRVSTRQRYADMRQPFSQPDGPNPIRLNASRPTQTNDVIAVQFSPPYSFGVERGDRLSTGARKIYLQQMYFSAPDVLLFRQTKFAASAARGSVPVTQRLNDSDNALTRANSYYFSKGFARPLIRGIRVTNIHTGGIVGWQKLEKGKPLSPKRYR